MLLGRVRYGARRTYLCKIVLTGTVNFFITCYFLKKIERHLQLQIKTNFPYLHFLMTFLAFELNVYKVVCAFVDSDTLQHLNRSEQFFNYNNIVV